MSKLFDPTELQRLAESVWLWVFDNVLVWTTAVQAGIVVLAFLLAKLAGPSFARQLDKLEKRHLPTFFKPLIHAIQPLSLVLIWLVLQWFTVYAAVRAGLPNGLIESVVSLLTAWVVIRFASGFIRDPGWARTLAVVAWSVAAMNLLGLLDPALATLDSMALDFGKIRISALGVLKAFLLLMLLLWGAGVVARLAERQLATTASVSPSAKVLIGKLIRVALIAIAIVAALQSVGVDLTALAVLGGAVGLGIGFGLQTVISNLISGVILLMDRSVKPGDVIAVEDTFGWINRLSARYVSVITRDGTEHLIPNETLISQRVENWSYSDRLIRLKLPIGVAYESDVPKAMELAVEAAHRVDRVLKNPEPVCRLMNFGADSVELELRVWIEDPQKGVANVRSDILLIVWNLYHENQIVFPFSQRDLHLRSSVPIDVRVGSTDPAPDNGGEKG